MSLVTPRRCSRDSSLVSRVLTYSDTDAEGGDDLLDEVERVLGDGGVGDCGAVVERHHVALGQPRAQLPQHLLVPVLAEPYHLRTTVNIALNTNDSKVSHYQTYNVAHTICHH